MEFGIQFFPDIGPETKAADAYFRECLDLVGLCDALGYSHVRTVEHYFNAYGGYSPNPIVFLTAAALRTARARLITGAVLPVFNNPLKLAGEIGMLDAIRAAGWKLVSRALSCPMSSGVSGSMSTKAGRASRKAWSKSAACLKTRTFRWPAASTASRTSPRCHARPSSRVRLFG